MCDSCGTELDDGAVFCPKCGKNIETKKANNEEVATKKTNGNVISYKKIQNILPLSLLVLSMLISFICCFFVQINVSGEGSFSLFNFFGAIYKELGVRLFGIFNNTTTVPIYFSSVFAGIGLFGAFTTLLVGCIKLGIGLYYSTEIKGIEKLTVLSFISFLSLTIGCRWSIRSFLCGKSITV